MSLCSCVRRCDKKYQISAKTANSFHKTFKAVAAGIRPPPPIRTLGFIALIKSEKKKNGGKGDELRTGVPVEQAPLCVEISKLIIVFKGLRRRH